MKTINVSDETWAALAAIKLDKRLPSMEEVIIGLMGSVNSSYAKSKEGAKRA